MTQPHIDVVALARLARLDVSPEELQQLEREIPDILAFVETIQSVAGEVTPETPPVRNVMRNDENPHESGLYTKTLLDAAPATEDGYFVVKKVLHK